MRFTIRQASFFVFTAPRKIISRFIYLTEVCYNIYYVTPRVI